jgi:hypothetical protein
VAGGGGLSVTVDGTPTATSLAIDQTLFTWNTSRGGNGGAGAGSITAGGAGGAGAGALGAGLCLDAPGSGGPDVWTLTGGEVAGNVATSGNGGNGGDGYNAGSGGDSSDSYGGGIYDGFSGTLKIFQGSVLANRVVDGAGGQGGKGHWAGVPGMDSQGYGGGLAIAPGKKAGASSDTHVHNNRADHKPNVFGTLGKV